MIHPFFLFLVLATLSAGAIEPSISAIDPQATDGLRPSGLHSAVLLVIDGLGSSYIYPDQAGYTLSGDLVPDVVLFNLSRPGVRVQDVRAPVPVTAIGHSVLVTGYSGADEETVGSPGRTIFDVARNSDVLCIALLQRGDFIQMLLEQDGALYFDDNSLDGKPVLATRAGLPVRVRAMLDRWREAFKLYGGSTYARYDRWGLDAATDIVNSIDNPFLLIVNLGGIDSSGHNRGEDGYLYTVSALDPGIGALMDACEQREVILVVTADHGMVFSDSKGGHASGDYAKSLESRRIPLYIYGPRIEDLIVGGVWSQADIAPTLTELMGLEENVSFADGRQIPLPDSTDLDVILSGITKSAAIDDGTSRKQSGSGTSAGSADPGGRYVVSKAILGGILIVLINLLGIVGIMAIWKKG